MLQHLLFQLGREHQLALAELAAVSDQTARLTGGSRHAAILELDKPADVQKLQLQLAGTVRIAQPLFMLGRDWRSATLIDQLVADLTARSVRDFGISLLDSPLTRRDRDQIGLTVKKRLKSLGQSARFVAGKEVELSSVLVRDQLIDNGREYLIVKTEHDLVISETVTVQNWQAWSFRDYDRPARDPKRGMLPPKLARMMVNLAQGQPDQVLLDPFCGVGTVLMEAGLLGYQHLIGSDQDERAIAASIENWLWLKENYSQLVGINLDLQTVALEKLMNTPARVVVTEADLGPPNFAKFPLSNRVQRFQQLESSYRVWLTQLWKLLPTASVVVLAYPILREPLTELPISSIAKQIGWQISPPLPPVWVNHPAAQGSTNSVLNYARPGQLIGRQILRLMRF